jgi:hypothetical protein
MIGPLDGQQYGFPKPIDDLSPDTRLNDWLRAQGYPQELINRYPGGVPCVVFDVPDGSAAPLGDPIRGARDLLQLSDAELSALVAAPNAGAGLLQTDDLIRIARALAILIPHPQGPSGWMRSPNSHTLFAGASALDLLLGDPSQLANLRQYLESQLV